MKLIDESHGLSVNSICMERGRLVIVSDELVSSLNYSGDVLYIITVEPWFINVRNSKGLNGRSFHAQLLRK